MTWLPWAASLFLQTPGGRTTLANSSLSLHCTVDTLDTSIPPTLSVTSVNEIQLYNTLFVPLKSANIITIMFRPIRTHQYSSESEIPSMSYHFQKSLACLITFKYSACVKEKILGTSAGNRTPDPSITCQELIICTTGSETLILLHPS